MVLQRPDLSRFAGGRADRFQHRHGERTITLNEGWFSEASVGEILWDLFDATNEPGDGVALGFAPLFAVDDRRAGTTDALTSIFTFSTGLRAANAGSAGGDRRLCSTGEDIYGTDDFGAGETNDGAAAIRTILPVYSDITLNDPPITVCSRSPFGNAEQQQARQSRVPALRQRRAAPGHDPGDGRANGGGTVRRDRSDIFVLRRGTLARVRRRAPAARKRSLRSRLPAGTYIIEVYDFDIAGAARCRAA